jgi:hypothetical protein
MFNLLKKDKIDDNYLRVKTNIDNHFNKEFTKQLHTDLTLISLGRLKDLTQEQQKTLNKLWEILKVCYNGVELNNNTLFYDLCIKYGVEYNRIKSILSLGLASQLIK